MLEGFEAHRVVDSLVLIPFGERTLHPRGQDVARDLEELLEVFLGALDLARSEPFLHVGCSEAHLIEGAVARAHARAHLLHDLDEEVAGALRFVDLLGREDARFALFAVVVVLVHAYRPSWFASFERGSMKLMNLPVRVVRVGNSRAILIPAIAARELGLEIGAIFDLDAKDKGEMRLTERREKKKKR